MGKNRASAKYQKQMKNLFMKADVDQGGALDLEEFRRLLSEDDTKTMLAAMELEVGDAKALFDFLRAQDHDTISLQELVAGVQRLKGTARSIDVVALMRKVLNIESVMQDCCDRLANLKKEQQSMDKRFRQR